MNKIPELLAPAGGLLQLKAAVENGADAVYMGGKLFNARMNAENFEQDEIREAVSYAHLKGVKLYVTMNTLLNDEELIQALTYAAELYDYGVDALILQDIGLAKIIKENIPEMEIHFSTQGTIYNSEGVKAAKKIGFSRVVLARELSLEEIQTIAREQIIDLEVFVHGAMCICYSGQCQMSNEIGGRSGNRGACAQPCRLPYEIYKKIDNEEILLGKTAYALSPKDLCTIEHIGKLAEAGVHSLKIEGRMKSPEYVAIVTRIYRKYLDIYAKQGSYSVTKEDIKTLNQIFNRGNFTEGYLFGNPKKFLMSGDLPKHQGVLIGHVKSGNRKTKLIELILKDSLALGDGIEIRSEGLPGNVVTFMKKDQKGNCTYAEAGDVVTVGDITGRVNPGDEVYKITDKELMQKARASYEGNSWKDEKQLKKVDINVAFTALESMPITLKVWDDNGIVVSKVLDSYPEIARTKSLDEEIILVQLNKTGGTPFQIVDSTINVGKNLSVPLSKINQLRRDALYELQEKRSKSSQLIRKSQKAIYIEEKKLQIMKSYKEEQSLLNDEGRVDKNQEKPYRSLYLFQGKDLINADLSWLMKSYKNESSIRGRIYLPYHSFLDNQLDNIMKGYREKGYQMVPVIPNITKGWNDKLIRKNFDYIADIAIKYGISIGNLGWIEEFVKTGADVYGDYGLNLHNSADFLMAKQLGLKEAVISHEASYEEIKQMVFHGVKAELAVEGKIPVMTSEHCPLGDIGMCDMNNIQNKRINPQELDNLADVSKIFYLKDANDKVFRIISKCENCQSVIISHKDNKLRKAQELLKLNSINCLRSYGN